MSYNYQDMLSSFKDWVNNSSLFVKRQVGRIPELTWDSKDDMFSNLTQPDPEMDDNTTQNLEIIFNSFVVVSERMLKGHLQDGKYGNPTPELI